MAKRFRLRISRLIPSFQSCRSKDPSCLPADPAPSFLRLSPVNSSHSITLRLPPPPPSKSHDSSLKRHVSSAFTSFGCVFGSKSTARYLPETDRSKSPPPLEFHWEQEEKWHVIAKVYNDEDETPRRKIYNSSVSGDTDDDDNNYGLGFPAPLPAVAERKKRRARKKKTTHKNRISTSSADSGLFSSESHFDENSFENEETETLVSSSRSFSTDSSSEFNPHLETIRESPFLRKNKKKKKQKKPKRYVVRKSKRNSGVISTEMESPARLSMVLRRMVPCVVEGKVRESFAVVKKSEDPYEDFKRSMMEMIMEKEMFEERDLEQLLGCFLTLNSKEHHRVIVEAFAEIWESLSLRRLSHHHQVSRAI